ncbi:MAG: DUF4390 domain-containing protein [Desulfobacterales bacterium]|nr:DUF4390 domain-containing protein [Desulfobacterales bacterium]
MGAANKLSKLHNFLILFRISVDCIRRGRFLIFIFTLFFVQGSAYAREVKVANITITNLNGNLVVYSLNIEGAFTTEMKKAVLSGVPTTFSYLVTLHRVRSLWADKEIANIKVTHTIEYNSMKKEFVVKRSWENYKPEVVQSFEEARKLMTEIDNLKIVPLNKLEKGKKYQVRAKAELSKMTLPLYLHYVLFFVSLWDFETEWYSIDFTY